MGDIAKVFWSGRSQAVRLPKEFRFDAKEVRIRRDGEAVILEPVGDDEWANFPRLPDDLADEMLAATEEEVPQQERLASTTSRCAISSIRTSSSHCSSTKLR